MDLRDIATIDDIHQLVNTFYGKVKEDVLIGPVFNKVIDGNWGPHLDKMYRFWQTVLLEEYTYSGGPFPPHAKLPIDKEHFDQWLSLWNETIGSLFSGAKADEAKWRAEKMAVMFLGKLEYYRGTGKTPLI